MKKLLIIGILLVLSISTNKAHESYLPVYQLSLKPIELTSGNKGMSLTIDISYGDEDVEKWIDTLEKPYPLLFLNTKWMERSPEIMEIILKKKIPVGLLGKNGSYYETNTNALTKEIASFTKITNEQPLYFRTKDGIFPTPLLQTLWNKQINPIGATIRWQKNIPQLNEGTILQVPLHRNTRIPFDQLEKLRQMYQFQSIEETILGIDIRTKTYP